MKAKKFIKKRLPLYWIRHREAVIILFCLCVVLFAGLYVAEYLIEQHPYLCLSFAAAIGIIVLLTNKILRRYE